MKNLMLAVLMVGCMSSQLAAQPHDMEFTPGPRMIRAIEQIAGYYAHLGHSLGLTPQQKEAMAGLVQRIKTEMWMKEAVLVGMFQELEEKRRHGLLQDTEYRSANTLTGGIETDELTLFIETLANLRGVLTADQQTKVRESSHPAMTFRISQGFNTKIGLMSLDGIGRVYNGYRDELRLTDAQAHSIQSLLEAARREVLRLGTDIDLSRVEADELVMRPEVDPEVIRAKMQKTGETEGVLFNKLFQVSDQIDRAVDGRAAQEAGRAQTEPPAPCSGQGAGRPCGRRSWRAFRRSCRPPRLRLFSRSNQGGSGSRRSRSRPWWLQRTRREKPY